MYFVKVFVGKFIFGNSKLKILLFIDLDRIEYFYDLVVDLLDFLIVFVVFYDDQCYFEYLIIFIKVEREKMVS